MAKNGIVAGVDTAKLEEFRTAQRKDPVKLGLKAKALWEGEMGRATVHVGPYQLNDDHIDRPTRHYTTAFGAWKEVEEAVGMIGPTDRQEPVEMALAAMAACVVNSITYNAYRHGIKLDDLEVTVGTDVNPDVLFELRGPEEHTACMQNLRAEIKVKGEGLTPEKLEIIKRLAEHSPVDGLISQANRITHVVTT
ncbi:MAG: OsmC family protein [Dehalococcoidia bacterium]